MKTQFTVITKLGTFNGDILIGVTADDIAKTRNMCKDVYNTNSFWITKDSERIYFPAEVIRKSVVILDVQNEDDPEGQNENNQ